MMAARTTRANYGAMTIIIIMVQMIKVIPRRNIEMFIPRTLYTTWISAFKEELMSPTLFLSKNVMSFDKIEAKKSFLRFLDMRSLMRLKVVPRANTKKDVENTMIAM